MAWFRSCECDFILQFCRRKVLEGWIFEQSKGKEAKLWRWRTGTMVLGNSILDNTWVKSQHFVYFLYHLIFLLYLTSLLVSSYQFLSLTFNLILTFNIVFFFIITSSFFFLAESSRVWFTTFSLWPGGGKFGKLLLCVPRHTRPWNIVLCSFWCYWNDFSYVCFRNRSLWRKESEAI